MLSSKPLPLLALLLALWAAGSPVASSQLQPPSPQQDVKPGSAQGKQTFASTCAGCHGLDGRGGERAPNIADRKAQRLSDAQIFRIIENGIPETGMPAFRSLESSDIKAVVTYLRTLQGTNNTAQPPGNSKRGETIFFGQARCSSCHMIAGRGGFIASDLSGYTRTHTVEQIRSAITNPTGSDRQARLVTAITRDGEKHTGRIRNEDNFSLQLQAMDGTFHFLSKADLQRLEYDSQPLMPSDYGATLSTGDLNDVISYVMSVAHTGTSPPEPPQKEFEEE